MITSYPKNADLTFPAPGRRPEGRRGDWTIAWHNKAFCPGHSPGPFPGPGSSRAGFSRGPLAAEA